MKWFFILSFVLSSNFSYSQKVINLTATQMSSFDESRSTRTKKAIQVNYQIQMYNDRFVINGENVSTYFLKGVIEKINDENENINVYQCIDNSGIRCKVMFSHNKKKVINGTNRSLTVMYNNPPQKMIIYRIKIN